MKEFFHPDGLPLPSWLASTGPDAELCLTTHARLIRNLKAHFFPHHADAEELETICGDLTRRLGRSEAFDGGWVFRMEDLSGLQRRILRERLLASGTLVKTPEHRGLLVDLPLASSARINDRDHVRLTAMRSGFDPFGALKDVLRLDDQLEVEVEPAYSEDLGYLTSTPSELGTGLCLSAVLHLPGLVLVDEIDKVLNALRQLQFTVRGLFGSGNSVRGALFMVTNLITLGKEETEIAEDFQVHVGKILTYERAARAQLLGRDPVGLEDMVHRSRGVLSTARLITSQEAFDCLSNVRLGLQVGLLPAMPPGTVNEAMLGQQSGHLEMMTAGKLEGRNRTAARADYLRGLFA